MRKVAQKYSTLNSTPLSWLDLEELPWLLVKVVEPEWAYFKWISATSRKEGGYSHIYLLLSVCFKQEIFKANSEACLQYTAATQGCQAAST
jgi:hypothetical protein